MTATALFLTAALAAATPGTTSTSTPGLSGSTVSDQQRPPREGRPTTGPERPHQIGVGGQLMIGSQGAAGGMRLFFGERVGVNFTLGWYRNGPAYANAPSQGSTFAAMPSVIVMLSKPNLSRQVDIRPYVGGGVNYVNASTPRTSSGVPYT